MQKIIKFVGLFILIIFSFFYTDKVAKVVIEKDSLMVKIKQEKNNYEVAAIDGIIDKDTVVPGIEGKSVNIDKTYKKLRKNGVFNQEFIQYDILEPKNSIRYNKDKYVISGNHSKKMVSIIFILDNDKYINIISNYLINKDIIVNYFVDYRFLVNNSTYIKELENVEVYNYGNDGVYTPDNLLFANNLISRIRNNDAIYCLTNVKDYNKLKLCSSNNLYTILPNIVVYNNSYNQIKKKLKSGSIILMDMNNTNVIEFGIIIDYIKGKGLDVVGLSKLLSESMDG